MKHCEHCNKDFATPSSLTRHNNSKHTNQNPALARHEHRCPSCDARFARNETLQRHIRSRHTLELMERCQFCLENFRKDYFAWHESRCARKYWTKVCSNAKLTREIQDDQSKEINRRPPVRQNVFPDAEHGLRVVHEVNVDNYLASRAFKFVFQHFYGIRDVESCLEAIALSFCHSIPIKTCIPEQYPDPLKDFYRLAVSVEEYVRGDRNINDPDVYGVTLMDCACSTGATSLIEPLFWRGAKFGNKSLLYAVRSGSFDTVRFCLTLGADPNDFMVDWDDGNSPLTLASASPENSHLVSLLTDYGADVFVRNDDWKTPLHLAARRADVDLLRVLLARDSSSEFLDATDGDGQRALYTAIEGTGCVVAEDQALGFVSALLDAGAEANGTDYLDSAMFAAVYFDCGAILRLLLNREPESTRKTEYLNEALVGCYRSGGQDVIGILVEAGASVDDEELRDALEYGSLDRVESLLKVGAPGNFVEDETLELLFGAARDQQEHGAEGWVSSKRVDAMGKCKLLYLRFPDDRRLRRFMDALEFEFENFR
jgi:ankyrin repeat protein